MTVSATGDSVGHFYSLGIDGFLDSLIAPNTTTVFGPIVRPFTYVTVFPPINCSPFNQQTLVPFTLAGDTITVSFDFSCHLQYGRIEVTAVSEGQNLPAAYTWMVGDSTGTMARDSTAVITVPLGTYVVDLLVAQNCTVTSPHPVTVEITPDFIQQVRRLQFDTQCQ